MLQLFNKVNSGQEIDFITLNGDIVGHGIPNHWGDSQALVDLKYPFLLKTWATAQQLFTENFPNTPVFITFGNNDCKYHYNWAS